MIRPYRVAYSAETATWVVEGAAFAGISGWCFELWKPISRHHTQSDANDALQRYQRNQAALIEAEKAVA